MMQLVLFSPAEGWAHAGIGGRSGVSVVALLFLNHLCKCSQQKEMEVKGIKYPVLAQYKILIFKAFICGAIT